MHLQHRLILHYLSCSIPFLALQYNKRYTKAYLRRAKAYEKLDRKQECLQGMKNLTCWGVYVA